MSAHTPGPWEVMQPHQTSGWGFCVAADGKIIARMTSRTGKEIRRANASLIVAAPDLLDALEALLAHCVEEDGQPSVGMARAAIAKARGES